jgi:hypothetical protein
VFVPPSKANFWRSPAVAIVIAALAEVSVFLSAVRDPIRWLACVQYAMLAIPPVILALAVRDASFDSVPSRVMLVFLVCSVLDLFYLR